MTAKIERTLRGVYKEGGNLNRSLVPAGMCSSRPCADRDPVASNVVLLGVIGLHIRSELAATFGGISIGFRVMGIPGR